jgi:membrane-bound lytic murein transglycosylase B
VIRHIFRTTFLLALTTTVLAADSMPVAAPDTFAADPQAQEFARHMAADYQFDAADLLRRFAQIRPNPTVLRLIAPPSQPSQRSWTRYRPRFVNTQRINGGVTFWRQHAATLARARVEFGVPEEIIVAIIGVETVYGKNTGTFGAMEALSTLAFAYPPRADFFRTELEQLLLVARENGQDPQDIHSSYAGALGLPQFMPGSLRRYAVDYDGDGRIDLQGSEDDAIGSVAHFLQQHGWTAGRPVAVPATLVNAPAPAWIEAGIRPTLHFADLQAAGVRADAGADQMVTLVDLVTPDAPTEYWLGFDNFYVITRYNRSSFYAMSVFQLAEEIRHQHDTD